LQSANQIEGKSVLVLVLVLKPQAESLMEPQLLESNDLLSTVLELALMPEAVSCAELETVSE
jgi:hypothetical protein